MFVVHRVVNGHPQYRSADNRSTFLKTYFAKNIVCATELGIFGARTDVFRPKKHIKYDKYHI